MQTTEMTNVFLLVVILFPTWFNDVTTAIIIITKTLHAIGYYRNYSRSCLFRAIERHVIPTSY